MLRLKKIEKSVHRILIAHQESRDNDNILFMLAVSEKIPMAKYDNFEDVMRNKFVPSYASIVRARRKLQADREELRGKKYNDRHRLREEYKDYALEEN